MSQEIDEEKLLELDRYLRELEKRRGLSLGQITGLFAVALFFSLASIGLMANFTAALGRADLTFVFIAILISVIISLIMTIITISVSTMSRTRRPPS